MTADGLQNVYFPTVIIATYIASVDHVVPGTVNNTVQGKGLRL
jgi:hypothetical protein